MYQPSSPLPPPPEWAWRCVVRQQMMRVFAAILGLLSAVIIFAEATMLSQAWVDLSLVSLLVKSAGTTEEAVQVIIFLPLVFMCVCTYFSVFKLGMFSFYYLIPGHTDSVSLLMNCGMVARFAAPMCYNFLSLIHLTRFNTATETYENLTTTFEQVREPFLPPPLATVLQCYSAHQPLLCFLSA